MGDLVLAVHFAWTAWMISGVILALAGFVWPRVWRWRVFRILHLAGIAATATVPMWAGGVCPLTRWEADALGNSAAPEPFLIPWMRRALYWDVSPVVLSLLVAVGAAITLAVFIAHPPKRGAARP